MALQDYPVKEDSKAYLDCPARMGHLDRKVKRAREESEDRKAWE